WLRLRHGLPLRRLRNGGDERPAGQRETPVPASRRRAAVFPQHENGQLSLVGRASRWEAIDRLGDQRRQQRQWPATGQEQGIPRQLVATAQLENERLTGPLITAVRNSSLALRASWQK